jgi:4-methylaminobutanoate oxidase (formaldehyde-forming)
MAKEFPIQAQVVIVGGGVIGCSVAYHLTKVGWADVVLLERRQLTCGTTWHAAGLITQLRATHNMTRLALYSNQLYASLEEETGQSTGYTRCGGLTVANIITPSEVKVLWPMLNVDDLVGAVHLPKDAKGSPVDTTQALAKGAQMGGARIIENTKVTAIHVKDGRITGVSTEKGDIACEVVVNCGGMWGREVGRMAGVNVPLHAAEHFYIVTEPMAGMTPDLPILRDLHGCAYYKEETGKLMLGAFEPVAKPWGMDGIPEDFSFDQLPDDWEQFEPIMEIALDRLPALRDAGVQLFFNGPESFTPDDRYLLGEAPETRSACCRPAVPARYCRNGSPKATRRWTCGMWTSGA